MGTPLGDVLPKKEISFGDLRSKVLAIDAYNTIYQFLASIRQPDGTPLVNSNGVVTSHLSGLFYRTLNFLERGIKPFYVFDGKPPELKERTLMSRKEEREKALSMWAESLEEGDLDSARKYSKRALFLSDRMVEESKELLSAMGIPFMTAPSEGEAQAAYVSLRGDAWAVASQDYDSLLFGAPRLVRNIAITGKRKLPGKDVYVNVNLQLIDEDCIAMSGLDRRKLIWVGMLLGTDYNEKVPGIGPKKALELVEGADSFESILRKVGYTPDWDWKEVERIFLEPAVTDDYRVRYLPPDEGKIFEILVERNDFSRERVEKAIKRLIDVTPACGEQTSLSSWF